MAEFLKLRGAEITLANHGAEAVERVSRGIFDAVLMDLHMPIMDGFEAARRIRELPQGKSLPVIAMTAAVLQADRDRCNAAGMVDFIAKPIDPEDMIRVLLKWVKTDSQASRSAIERGIEPAGGVLPASLPGFDIETALRRLDGNSDLLARLLLGFAGKQSGTLAQLGALVQADDSTQAEAARPLEQEVKAGGELSAMQGFADAFNAALDAIKTYVAPAQSIAGKPAIDRQELAETLNRLTPYLQEQELIPLDLMESLRSLARLDLSDKSLARLIQQVDHFDHDGALASVVQLAAIHGVALGSEEV